MGIARTEAMAQGDGRSGLTCGIHALDDYFARHALANSANGLGKTYVWRGDTEDGEPAIMGYDTLSMATVGSKEIKDIVGLRLPRYPMPVALIGRLAVHTQAQGKGLGSKLLADALGRVVSVAEVVGCLGVIVDAKNEAALRFYERFGFVSTSPSGSWPRRMFIALAPGRQSLGS